MKLTYLLAGSIALVAASCTTAYRSAQTPDDVYYSTRTKTEANVQTRGERNEDAEYYTYESADRRRMAMRMRDYRWRHLDAYDAYYGSYYRPYMDPYASLGYYSPYYSGVYGGYYSSYYNPYYGYAFGNLYSPFYSPYYGGQVIVSKPYTLRSAPNATPRSGNMRAYREVYSPRAYNTAPNTGATRNPVRIERSVPRSSEGERRRTYEPSNERTYSPPANNTNNNSSGNSNRSYNPSSGSGSSSGGSISRPSRGN